MADIIEIINRKEKDKRNRRIIPNHALFVEVLNRASQTCGMSRDEVTIEIYRLQMQGKIKVANTINNKCITFNK